MSIQQVFERTEKKYIITLEQRERLLALIDDKIKADEYGESTVCSLYFDTDDYRMIRSSLEKPVYKEKLRLRSYGTPKEDGNVFLEIKKKFNGVVYKRRETLKYSEAKSYYTDGEKCRDTQIMHEIDWAMKFYPNLRPRMFIGYDRTAFYCATDDNIRLTFDRNVRFRTNDLDLAKGSKGEVILDSNLCIMEVKVLSAMPLWLSSALNEIGAYPGTFSKYGTAYQIVSERKLLSQNNINFGAINAINAVRQGGKHCA